MKLFSRSASPFVRKVRVIARETGLAESIEEIGITSLEEMRSEMPKYNPLGKIPALIMDDGNILYRNAPDGNGTFSVYQLAVAKDHKANLQGTLESRVKALAKSGLVVTAEVKGKTQTFDGKPAVFGVIPVEAKLGKDTIKFRYYLVLIDAKDTVVIMQAALPSPLPDKIRESALEIIQSFREKE